MCSAVAEQVLTLELLPVYLDTLVRAGRSRHTISSTRSDLAQLATFLRSQDLRATTTADLTAFFAWLGRQHGNGASSLRRKTSTVKGFFQFLHTSGRLLADPSIAIPYPPAEHTHRRHLTSDECDAMFLHAETPSWAALVACLVDCGLKRDEVAALRWGNLDLAASNHGLLHVRHRQASQRVRRRTLPMSERLRAALALHRGTAGTDPLVFSISARGIDFIVETVARRAGVRPDARVTPQMLRDAFATRRTKDFMRREQRVVDDAERANLAREHDRILLRELGLADSSASAARFRRLADSMEPDRPEGVRLLDA